MKKQIFRSLLATSICLFPINANAQSQNTVQATQAKTDAFFVALTTVCDGNPTAVITRQGFTAQFRPGVIFKQKTQTLESTDLEKLNKGIVRKFKFSYFITNPTYMRKYEQGGISQWVLAGNNGGILGANAGNFQSNLTNQFDALSRAFGGEAIRGTYFIMDTELSAGLSIIDFEYNLMNDGTMKLVALSGDQSKEISVFEKVINSGVKFKKRDCSKFSSAQNILADVVTFGLRDAKVYIKQSDDIRGNVCNRRELAEIRSKWPCEFSIKARPTYSQNLSLTETERRAVISATKEIDDLNLRTMNNPTVWGDFDSEANMVKYKYQSLHPNLFKDYEAGLISDYDFINKFHEKDHLVVKFMSKSLQMVRSIIPS